MVMPQFDREDYDELEAYKIIMNMYEVQKSELNDLEEKLKNCYSELEKIEESICNMKDKQDNDLHVFSPIKSNNYDKIDQLEKQKNEKEKQKKFIHERILKTRELVAKYSFVMSVLKEKQKESENQNLINNDFLQNIIDKISFCKDIVTSDPLRVKEELDALSKILIQIK